MVSKTDSLEVSPVMEGSPGDVTVICLVIFIKIWPNLSLMINCFIMFLYISVF